VDGKRASGVQLQDGTTIKANKLVLTSLEPHQTFLELIGEEHLPQEFIPRVKRWRHEHICGFTTHLALDEPLKWKSAAFNEDISRSLGVLLVDNPQELVDDFAEIDRGELPSYPRMFTANPSQVDPTQAPPGKATALAWELSPYQIRGKEPEAWDDMKEEFAQRCIDVWDSYTTNMKKALLKSYAQSPLDTERRWISMVHGGFNHGELVQDQMNIFRPFFEYKPYRTPFENLYMCGAATHPAGNLSGACGWNAVQAIAEDLKFKKKWWA
jgi:phytoene dehydrogenase-like protein